MERHERRRGRRRAVGGEEHIEGGPKGRGRVVERLSVARVVPCARVQAVDQGLEGRDRLGRCEATVAGAVHVDLAQQIAVARRLDRTRVGLFLLHLHQPVAGCVHGQDRGWERRRGRLAGR